MTSFRVLATVLVVAVSVTLFGCAEVQPWQRGHIARPDMALRPDPAQRALREHVYMSREAALAGAASAGGGCGCY